jgi:hypothetical protein
MNQNVAVEIVTVFIRLAPGEDAALKFHVAPLRPERRNAKVMCVESCQ